MVIKKIVGKIKGIFAPAGKSIREIVSQVPGVDVTRPTSPVPSAPGYQQPTTTAPPTYYPSGRGGRAPAPPPPPSAAAPIVEIKPEIPLVAQKPPPLIAPPGTIAYQIEKLGRTEEVVKRMPHESEAAYQGRIKRYERWYAKTYAPWKKGGWLYERGYRPKAPPVKEEKESPMLKTEIKAPPGVLAPYKPPAWKKEPLKRATYEITTREEKLYQRGEPGYIREAKGFGYGVAGVGLGIAGMIRHPIKAVKGYASMIRHPLRTGAAIGKRLETRPGAFTGEVAAFVGLAKAPKLIPKARLTIGKKVSPKYIPKAKAGIDFGKWTEIVPAKRELALAGRKITVTQVSPKAWFKPYRKIAKVKPAKVAEMRYPRRVAGEVYTYWQPPTPKGKPKALLGFGGVEPAAETGLLYALRHPTKVKWTVFGKPTAEIKLVKGRIEPLPKKIMKMKPSIKAERAAAEYIVKRPGKFYLPAEIKRVTRPMERGGFQEYQVVLAPATKLRAVGKKWTEIYGQRVKIVEAELPKQVLKPSAPKIPIARRITLERFAKPRIPPKKIPYYKPTKYYPVSKVVRVGLVPSYKPTKYYKPKYPPTKYYKPSVYKPTKYIPTRYYAPSPYVKAPYKPAYYKAPYYVQPKLAPAPYYPAKPTKALFPIALTRPIVFRMLEGKRRKRPRKLRKVRQPQAYVPSLTATILRIKGRKPYVVPKKFKYGFLPTIRPITK